MQSGIGSVTEAEAFYALHHCTQEEWRASVRPHLVRNTFEDEHAVELEGEPPAGASTRGLPPHRARLARYNAWCVAEDKKLAELLALRSKMQSLIDVPAATEAEIKIEVRKTASYFMGREQTDGADTAKRRKLDERLAIERHTADAALEVLAELAAKIEVAGLRLERLHSRESEFVGPALIEAADELGLGSLYVHKIAELKRVSDALFGLVGTVGRVTSLEAKSYDARYASNVEAISFPVVSLLSMPKGIAAAELTIASSGSPDVWKKFAHAMRLNPDVDAGKFIALPK